MPKKKLQKPLSDFSTFATRKPLRPPLDIMKKHLSPLLLALALLVAGTSCSPIDSLAKPLPQGFVYVSQVIPDVLLEIRYYSTYNFVGRRIDGYHQPQCILTQEAAAALKVVSDELGEQGYVLKLYDGYRPQQAVDHFVRWAQDVADTLYKASFYPEVDKALLFDLGFIFARSGHSRGSTIDLTLVDKASGKELDMGGVFDYFGERSHPDYEGITPEQKANRMILREAMLRHGFLPLESEWWHFTLQNEPFPDTYFNFPIE